MSNKFSLFKWIYLPGLLIGLVFLAARMAHLPVPKVLAFLQDQQAISAYFQRSGAFGPVVLFLLMLFQVFIAVLPGQPLMLAGGYIFGPLTAILITTTSTILGSQLAFWLARRYGRKLVERLVNPAELQRWNKLAERQGTLFFFACIVVPFLPSDLMCYVAGLGTISTGNFLVANVFGRFISAMMITLIGAFNFNPPWQYWVLILGSILIFIIAWRLVNRRKGLPDLRPKLAHELGMWLIRTYQHLFSIRLVVRGFENIPASRKVLACNHPNCSDTFLLPALFDGNLRILMVASQFRQPLLGWIFTHTGQIPVQKEDRRAAYLQACQALTQGETILLYPEGRLNPDHEPVRINTGAVRMALACRVPIIPMGIYVPRNDMIHINRFAFRPTCKKLWQWRGSLYVHFGEPWYPPVNDEKSGDVKTIRTLTDHLMKKIHNLETQAREEYEYENSHVGSSLPANDQRVSSVFMPPGRIPR